MLMYDSFDYVDEPPLFDDEMDYDDAIAELESYDELALFYETHERVID